MCKCVLSFRHAGGILFEVSQTTFFGCTTKITSVQFLLPSIPGPLNLSKQISFMSHTYGEIQGPFYRVVKGCHILLSNTESNFHILRLNIRDGRNGKKYLQAKKQSIRIGLYSNQKHLLGIFNCISFLFCFWIESYIEVGL